MTFLSRWLAVVLLIFAPSVVVTAESVSTLPAPTGYVNDFAGVLSPSTKANLENLCYQVDRQAHAQIAVVRSKRSTATSRSKSSLPPSKTSGRSARRELTAAF